MKALLLFFVFWGTGFAPLWYMAHELFLDPGDWIASVLVSFFLALGINGLRQIRFDQRDANLLKRSEGPLKDGQRVVVVGTIEPEGESITAPFSGRQCLAYDYEIGHYRTSGSASSSRTTTEVIDYGGNGLAPSIICSTNGRVRLNAFPGLEGFPKSASKDLTIDRVRNYLATTTFEKQSLLSGIGEIDNLINDGCASLRRDWQMTSSPETLDSCFFHEKILPVGAQACTFGRYCEEESAIAPEGGWRGVRMINGTREQGLKFLRKKIVGVWITSILMLAVPGPIAFAVLSIQENYAEAHGEPSMQSTQLNEFFAAVQAGDVAAIRRSIKRGVDVNAQDESGWYALARAG